MGEHHNNPRAKQFKGGALDFKVGFKVLVKPSRSWDEANVDMEKGEIRPNAKPPEEADMRIAIMMCITETIISPLATVPPKMVFHPCSVIYEENLEAFRINGMTPAEFEARLNAIPNEGATLEPGAEATRRIITREGEIAEAPAEPAQVAEPFPQE
jgi:hypothetical protein